MKTKPFTRGYFHSQLVEFRNFFGEKSFWRGERPALALSGLLYVFANTVGLREADKTLMVSTAKEYDRRLELVLAGGIYEPEDEE